MRTNSWRFYITPFLDSGEYGTEVEVTKDVVFNSLGTIQLSFDNSDYDIGILRNSNLSITMNNVLGAYSDVDVNESIFRYTRSNSKFRMTYRREENPNYAGMMVAGQTVLCTEVDVFVGLIDDNSAQTNLKDHLLPLSVLGYESLLDVAPVPTLANGDSVATTLYKLLNQTTITDYLTVALVNITPDEDQTIDDISPYEASTAKEAISDLLLASNSVLYIKDLVVYVVPRTATVAVQKTFYGQAALDGIENIISIDSVRSGFAKVFNYLTWQDDPTIIVEDGSSVSRYNIKAKEFAVGFFTNTTKIRTLLGAILDEFAIPKQEFVLATAVNYDTLALWFLDRVTVNYPLMVNGTCICGIAVCGEALLPTRLSNFYQDPPTDFKIIDIEINIKDSIIKFKLRKI